MSLESLIEDSGQQADIAVESPDYTIPPRSQMGGTDRSAPWGNIATGVPCLVRTQSSSLSAWPGRNDARANINTTRIYFYSDPVPTGISTRHRITVTTQGTGGHRVLGVYAVQGVVDPNSMGRLFEVDCERIRSTP